MSSRCLKDTSVHRLGTADIQYTSTLKKHPFSEQFTVKKEWALSMLSGEKSEY